MAPAIFRAHTRICFADLLLGLVYNQILPSGPFILFIILGFLVPPIYLGLNFIPYHVKLIPVLGSFRSSSKLSILILTILLDYLVPDKVFLIGLSLGLDLCVFFRKVLNTDRDNIFSVKSIPKLGAQRPTNLLI